jgi:parallel beta-helix repeat protein
MRLDQVFTNVLVIALAAGAASASTWNVDSANPSCNDGSCTPCCTIQGAVYQSSGGDVISVSPGTYAEQVDFRDMWSIGDITLQAKMGPGTVLVSAPSGHTLRHGGGYINTVTVDGVDFGSALTYSCVYINHLGDVVLRDVTIDGCGYTAFILDNPGSVTMERCTATNSERNGIQVDGASGATLTDCVADENEDDGFRVYIPAGTLLINNPTATDNGGAGLALDGGVSVILDGGSTANNGESGIWVDTSSGALIENLSVSGNGGEGISVGGYDVDPVLSVLLTGNIVDGNGVINGRDGIELTDISGAVVIDDCVVTDSGRDGIHVDSSGEVTITSTTISGSENTGIYIDENAMGTVDAVTLTNVDVMNNGIPSGDSGVTLRHVVGPIVVSGSTFDGNGGHGFEPWDDGSGDLEIAGGHANGNGRDGYDLWVVGNATVTGAIANNNDERGFDVNMPGTVLLEDCVANGNQEGSGFNIEGQGSDRLDAVSVIDCAANDNGLIDGGEGINIRDVDGPVTITGCSASGNAYSGIRIRDAYDTVLIRDNLTTFNLEEGIEIDIDGPTTIIDNISSNNVVDGLNIDSAVVEVPSINVKRNIIATNGGTGVVLLGLGGAGPFTAKCNDIDGNDNGMYLSESVPVDARHVWWGDPSGPSGQGPGTGDGVIAEPGGTILYDPWLVNSFTAAVSGCPFFTSDFETGLLSEWDAVFP